MNWSSGGFWLESAWLTNATNEWRFRSIVDVVFPFLRTAYGAVALGTVWWLFATKGPRESMRDLWLVATLASFGLGVVMAGKAGGSGNYLLETTACAAVLLATRASGHALTASLAAAVGDRDTWRRSHAESRSRSAS